MLDSSAYQSWVIGEEHTLYCPGIPGAGKTILSTIVINDLWRRAKLDPTHIGIAYVYFSYKLKSEQKINQVLRSLLRQLTQLLPSLPNEILELRTNHKDSQTQPTTRELSNLLRSVARLYPHVFIVLDALDECDTESGNRKTFLSSIAELQDSSHVRLFATSRPDEMEGFFDGKPWLEIRASDEDIRVFLEARIESLSGFISLRKNEDLRAEIKRKIAEAASGM